MMWLRFAALGVLVLMGALGLVSCGGDGSSESRPVLTAELVVPPASQVIVEAPTATVEPTATQVVVAEVFQSSQTSQVPQVNIPNRGYNSIGSEDAPITMFDFSDFL